MRTFQEKKAFHPEGVSSSRARAQKPAHGPDRGKHPILDLQRSIGNQAVLRMLRADAVQSRPELEHVQDEPAQSDRSVQSAALKMVDNVIHSPGTPLNPAVQASAEVRLGQDFSHVRVHRDEAATQSAEAVQARAYTVGSHIVFARDEYQPRTPRGDRLILHELVHVAQQGSATNLSQTPAAITEAGDASEREAHAITARSASSAPPQIAKDQGPVIARYDPKGGEEQEERSEAIQHGLSPYEPLKKPDDPFQKFLEKTLHEPRPPQPTKPGDMAQQVEAIPYVAPEDLWELPRIHEQMKKLTEETEARERAARKPGAKIDHTAENMMAYWKPRFIESVKYILYRRGDKPEAAFHQLREAEKKLIKSNPADLVAQVEDLRQKAKQDWLKAVDDAADKFVVLASNESLYVTTELKATHVSVFGLPKWVEGTVEASAHPKEMVSTAKPLAPSVITFIQDVQNKTHKAVKADNYSGHEWGSRPLEDRPGVGEYSFDVDLGGIVKVEQDGFYNPDEMVAFFKGVAEAVDKKFEWNAIYNDFRVIKQVNEFLGKARIGFSGGGGLGPFAAGSIHHGPKPYILHVHFNIMPIEKAKSYMETKEKLKDLVKKLAPLLDLSLPK
jgi:hypothetical protein